jgi:hypothetical protein
MFEKTVCCTVKKTVGVGGTVKQVSAGSARSANFCLADKTLSAFDYQKIVCLAALPEHCLPMIIRKLSAFAVSVRELSAMVNCWKKFMSCCTLRKLSAFLCCQKIVCLTTL